MIIYLFLNLFTFKGGVWPGKLIVLSVATWHADGTSKKIMDFNCAQKEKYNFLIDEKPS